MYNSLKVFKYFQMCAIAKIPPKLFISYVFASASSLDAIVRFFMLKELYRQNQWGI